MPDLTVPFTAATVFTLGGYGILRAERHAETIRGVLALAFLVSAMLCVLALLVRVTDDGSRPLTERRPVAQARPPRTAPAKRQPVALSPYPPAIYVPTN